jgi:hypothetical protein
MVDIRYRLSRFVFSLLAFKDTKTFWMRTQKIREPYGAQRYENLMDENPKDTKTFQIKDTETL